LNKGVQLGVFGRRIGTRIQGVAKRVLEHGGLLVVCRLQYYQALTLYHI
jgi:hypothetical protein